MIKKLTLFLILAVVIVSCSKDEDPLEREKKEMKEFFDNSKLLVPYKGVKIAMRVDYSDQSAKNLKISETGLNSLSAIASLIVKDSIPTGVMGLYDTYQKIKGLYELKKEINAINEDELPTIFKRLSTLEKNVSGSSTISGAIEKDLFGNYNNSTEHFLLGCIWFVLPSAPAEIYIYEAAQVNTNDIVKPDQHAFAGLLKALVCLEKEWYYTSEKSSTEYIDYLTQHKNEVLDATSYLDSVPGTDPDKRFYELRSLGYAMRGYVKQKSDREKEANEDFDRFVDDFDKSGVQNKEMSFLSAYICIKNNKPEKAEVFLKKMENSPAYNAHDKKTVSELRAFIKDKNGDEFNKYLDSFSLSRIAFVYLYQISANSDMAKELKKNEHTKQVISIPEKVNKAINASGNMLNADSLMSGAGKLLDGIFK